MKTERPALPGYFWVAVLATALMGMGANLEWVEAGGYGLSGQSFLVETSTPADPSLVYLAVLASAVGLWLYVQTRNPRMLLLCTAAAIGAGVVLGVDLSKLLKGTGFSAATGAYLTGASAVLLLLATAAPQLAVPAKVERPGTNPPGWHADPHGEADLRYWDGSRWTEHTHSHAASGEQIVERKAEPSKVLSVRDE